MRVSTLFIVNILIVLFNNYRTLRDALIHFA